MEEGVYRLRTPTGEEHLVDLKRGKFRAPAGRRDNQPIRCSCTGATKDASTVMDATDAGAVCPKCGKTLAIVKTPADARAEEQEWERKARYDLRLEPAGRTEDFGTAYRLTARLERSEWANIKHLMVYARRDDAMGMDADDCDLGWVTFSSTQVEEFLGITGDRTIAAQKEAAKRRREEEDRRRQELIAEGEALCERFSDRRFFTDWSWDDYGQRLGPVVAESDHWQVHEYLIDGENVGICLQAKAGNPVSPGDVNPGEWGYSRNSILGQMTRRG